MKCVYCGKDCERFFQSVHPECEKLIDEIIEQIMEVIERGYQGEAGLKRIYEIAKNNAIYQKYIERELLDKTAIYTKEKALYILSAVVITEIKNSCEMKNVGFCENRPDWRVRSKVLTSYGWIAFTEEALYFRADDGVMRYPYKKIVNCGYEDGRRCKRSYFDVKTTSPYPHRFYIETTKYNDKKDSVKSINQFLSCIKDI